MEQDLYEALPKPPKIAVVQSTCVWIIEWLPPGEKQTGHLLHCWMESRRPGWSTYHRAESKIEVIHAIERAAYRAQAANIVPVLHLEAHGDEDGLDGPLQPSHLLAGAKEFYRRWAGKTPNLGDIVESASREVEPAAFIVEPFALLAYESLVELMISSARPSSRSNRMARMRRRLLAETTLSAKDINDRLSTLAPLWQSDHVQHIWNQLFMIDQCPQNQERFGVDFKAISKAIGTYAGYALP